MPPGSSDNLEERDFSGVAIDSETWKTLNPDGPAYAEASARAARKTHFEFELTRKGR